MLVAVESRPSKKQRELLSFIDTFIKGNGYGPSYREVMRALNYKSVSTVAVHIDNLIEKGHLQKRTRSARSLEVVSGLEAPATEIPSDHHDWLLRQVAAHFDRLEKKASKKAVDEAFVLVGAMHVLRVPEAKEFKRRLATLATD